MRRCDRLAIEVSKKMVVAEGEKTQGGPIRRGGCGGEGRLDVQAVRKTISNNNGMTESTKRVPFKRHPGNPCLCGKKGEKNSLTRVNRAAPAQARKGEILGRESKALGKTK